METALVREASFARPTQDRSTPKLGATFEPFATSFAVWATRARHVDLLIFDDAEHVASRIPMVRLIRATSYKETIMSTARTPLAESSDGFTGSSEARSH